MSEFDLGEVLDKDRTSARHGIERANEFLRFNRDFSDRLQRARELISLWRPGEPLGARSTSTLGHIAKNAKTPPAVVPVNPASTPMRRDGEDPYEAWRRESCWNSEQKFLALATAEFSHLARVPVSEAAE